MWKTPNPIFLKPNLINKEIIIKSIDKINISRFSGYTINNNLYFHILYFLIFIIGILFLIYKYKEKKGQIIVNKLSSKNKKLKIKEKK
jgi:hypothetical protein